jgi:hypothetical protein
MLNAGVQYRLDLDVRDFQGGLAWVNGIPSITVTLDDLLWSAIMVGHPNPAAAAGVPLGHQWWANQFRMSIVLAYIDAAANGAMRRSSVYERADRSEKSAISYYIGLIAAKFVAARLLSVPFTWHFEQHLAAAGAGGTLSTRPDLIGLSRGGDWFVLECKGRTRGYDHPLLNRAKAQASRVSHITAGGHLTAVRAQVASISWMSDNGWAVRFDDPPSRSEVRLPDVSEDKLVTDYYVEVRSFILAARERGEARGVVLESNGAEFTVADDPALEVSVGLPTGLLFNESIGKGAIGMSPQWQPVGSSSQRRTGVRRPFTVETTDGESWTLGPDGVLVRGRMRG